MFIARIVLMSMGSRCCFKRWSRQIIGDYSNSKTSIIITLFFHNEFASIYRDHCPFFSYAVLEMLWISSFQQTLCEHRHVIHEIVQLNSSVITCNLTVRLVRCCVIFIPLSRGNYARAHDRIYQRLGMKRRWI